MALDLMKREVKERLSSLVNQFLPNGSFPAFWASRVIQYHLVFKTDMWEHNCHEFWILISSISKLFPLFPSHFSRLRNSLEQIAEWYLIFAALRFSLTWSSFLLPSPFFSLFSFLYIFYFFPWFFYIFRFLIFHKSADLRVAMEVQKFIYPPFVAWIILESSKKLFFFKERVLALISGGRRCSNLFLSSKYFSTR